MTLNTTNLIASTQQSSKLFFIDVNSKNISLNPLDSDYRKNSYILRQVISNLVSKNSSGNIVPIIAKSWKHDKAELIWEFEFNEGLKTESGELINPINFKKNIERLAVIYFEMKDLLLLPSLQGWDEFKNKKSAEISGIRAENNKLVIQFKEKPYNVLNYLALPYFGYYDSKNFSNGKWVNNRKIIASGPYKVISFSDKSIELEKFHNYFANPKSPNFVSIRYENQKELIKGNYSHMIAYGSDHWEIKSDSLVEINSTPSFFTTLEVNPFKSEMFKIENNRRIFRDTFLKYKNKYMSNYEGVYMADFVYFTNKAKPVKAVTTGKFKRTDEVVTLRFPIDSKIKRITDLTQALKSTFDELKISYKFMDYWDTNASKNIQAGDVYDIVYSGVDTGAAPKNSTIDMMWCTKMGVSFHDANGKICEMTKEYKNKSEYELNLEYQKRFNQIIEDDATILPLFHRGEKFIATKNIDFSNFGQISGAIIFNMIEFKNAE